MRKLGRALAGVLVVGTLWAGLVGVAYAEGESEEAITISVSDLIESLSDYGGQDLCASGCQVDAVADGYVYVDTSNYPDE